MEGDSLRSERTLNPVELEMKQYEELEVSETDSDVVKFWISNKSKFPKLF